MAASISNEGLKDLRAHVQSTWKYVELLDGSAGVIATTGGRLTVGALGSTGNRAVLINDNSDADAVITIQVTLTGTDADMGVGRVIGGAKLYNASTGGTSLVDVTYASPFTFQNTDDQLTIKLTVQIPG